MRCNDFDAHIDEMLAGILHPDANEHLRHCERCTSHLRSRATVQDGLRQLASAAVPGPSRATDRAVMDAYRQFQHRRAAASAPAAPGARLLTFPGSGGPAPASGAPARASRNWMSYAAAAAVVFAVLGSAAHLWNGVSTVNAPSVAGAPAASAPAQTASADASSHAVMAANAAATLVARHLWQHRPAPLSSPSNDAQANTEQQANAGQSEAAALQPESPALAAEASTPAQSNAAPIMHLASSGAVGGATGVAQSPGSSSPGSSSPGATWPGYSNLMYCDPVVCSGPMQVVHIKVPVGQVKPNLGSTEGNGFVNAEVVVGPDGVARAIRVAN